MADPSQYLINPDTQEVVEVAPEWVERAKQRAYTPASEQQIKEFVAKDEAARSPIVSGIKSIAEQALEYRAPTSLVRGILGVAAEPEGVTSYLAKTFLPESVAKGFEAAKTYAELKEKAEPGVRTALAGAAEALAPLTPTGAMLAAGVTTPEQIEARREAFGRIPESVPVMGVPVPIPLVGGMPVTSLLGLGAAVATPAGLSRVGKSLSGASMGVKALAAEEAAVTARTNALAAEAAGGPEVAAVQKAAEDAALKVVEAADSAAARRAMLAKIPGGERIATTVERALQIPDETSALNLVSKTVGGPIAKATEERARSLAALLPGLKSSPVLQEIVAKAAAQSAGSAADLALFSLGATSQEALLGDHKITAERALANMGHAIVDGAFLGAVAGGLPPTASASLSQFGKGVRGLNQWFERNVVRRGAGLIGEAEPSSIDIIAERRADLGKPVAELLEEEMARREPPPAPPAPPLEPTIKPAPFEPGLPPQLIVPELGMMPVTGTRPIERFPGLEPEAPALPPAEPIRPEMKPAELERATMSLWSTVRDAKRAMIKAEMEFTPIREAEEGVLIDRYYNEEAIPRAFQGPMLQQALKELGGRKVTPKDQIILDRLRNNIEQIPRDRVLAVGDEILGRIKAVGELDTGTLPLGVMKRSEALAEQLRELGRSKKTPAQIASAADKVARELFEMGKAPSDNVTMTLQEQRASRLAFDAGHVVRDFLIDPEMFGPAAARELSIRTNLTRVSTAMKNFDSLFSKKKSTGVKKFVYEPDPGKIQTYLESRGKPKAVLGDQAISDLREAFNDLYADMKQSASYYPGETGIPKLGERITNMAKALDEAEEQVALAASNKALEREFKVRQQEFERIKQQIKAEQDARNAQRKDIERRLGDADEERAILAKRELEAWRLDNEAAKTMADERIAAWEAREKARQIEIKEQQKVFDDAVKERRDYIKQQARLLSGRGGVEPMPGASLHPVISRASRLRGATKNTVAMYKTYAALEKAARAVEVKAKDAVKAIVRTDRAALAALKPPSIVRSADQERKQYAERAEKLLNLANDPDAMARHLDAVTSATQDAAPNISGHVKDVTSTGVMSLVNSIPAPPAGLPPYQRANWKPTDSQMREFNRKFDAVTNPMGVLYRVGEGSATSDEIKLINQVYSNLMRDVRQNVINTLGEDKDIPADRRMMLSKMLGIDVDGAPQLGMTAQAVYGNAQQPPPQSKQQMPVSRANVLRVAERSAEYDKPARQNAQVGARTGYGR